MDLIAEEVDPARHFDRRGELHRRVSRPAIDGSGGRVEFLRQRRLGDEGARSRFLDRGLAQTTAPVFDD